jgi:hypothetical protein
LQTVVSTEITHVVELRMNPQEAKEFYDSMTEVNARMPNWASNPQHLWDTRGAVERVLKGQADAPTA